MMTTQRTTQLAAWFAALGLTLWALLRLGEGALATPPFGSLAEMRLWLDGSGLAVAVFSLLRLVALAATVYLLATTLFGLLARLSRAGDLIYLADKVSVPVVRRMVNGTASITITAGALAGAALPVTATLIVDQRPDLATSALALGGPTSEPPHVLASRVTEAAVPSPGTDHAHPLMAAEPAQMFVVEDERPNLDVDRNQLRQVAAGETGTWLVEPGDHLWSIAERTLAIEIGAAPDQDSVFHYWRALVRTNHDRLVNADNPDLILPGQELLLPAIAR